MLKNKDISVVPSLFIIKKLLEEMENLEYFPDKLGAIYDYLVKQFKKEDFLKFDSSELNIEFFKQFYKLASNQNSKAKDSSIPDVKELYKKFRLNIQFTNTKKFKSSEEQYKNFNDLKLKLLNYIEDKYPYLFRNYFLNELFSNVTMFTNRQPFSENRFEVSLLGALIPQLLMIEKFSLSKNTISEDDILKAFYLTHKNMGFLTQYTGNFQTKIGDGLTEALKKIDPNSTFNSMIILFA